MRGLSLVSLFVTSVSSEVCHLPIDVMFLQDTTGSLLEDLPKMLEQVALIKDEIESMYPGSLFGVAEFQDKPFYPLGEADNVCYRLAGPLTADLQNFTNAYSALYGSGGADEPEGQFQAIINVVLDPAVNWRSFSLAPDGAPAPGSTGGRFVVLVTDGLPHIAGDMARMSEYPGVPKNLPANSGGVTDGDLDYACLYEDYPSPEQVKEVLLKYDINLVTLTPHLPRLTESWKWVNTKLLNQRPSFYNYIKSDITDFHSAVIQALQNVSYPITCPTEEP